MPGEELRIELRSMLIIKFKIGKDEQSSRVIFLGIAFDGRLCRNMLESVSLLI